MPQPDEHMPRSQRQPTAQRITGGNACFESQGKKTAVQLDRHHKNNGMGSSRLPLHFSTLRASTLFAHFRIPAPVFRLLKCDDQSPKPRHETFRNQFLEANEVSEATEKGAKMRETKSHTRPSL